MIKEWTPWHDQHTDKIERTSSCWLWTGASGGRGYGRVRYNETAEFAHRASYQEAKGSIPNGLLIRHLCHNKKCVRPSHLMVGTAKQNAMDTALAFRTHSTLSEEDVRSIRRQYDNGVLLSDIAENHGVAYGTVYPIVCYKAYEHVDPDRRGKHKRRITNRVTDEQISACRKLILEGLPNHEIAGRVSVRANVVSNIRRGARYANRGTDAEFITATQDKLRFGQ